MIELKLIILLKKIFNVVINVDVEVLLGEIQYDFKESDSFFLKEKQRNICLQMVAKIMD